MSIFNSTLMEINILLFIATAIIELALVLVAWRLGKSYLQAFIIMNIVLTGLFVGVLVPIFGLITTAGEVFYAAIFIATDILSEHYGKREGLKTVFNGFFVLAAFTLLSQIGISYLPFEDSQVISNSLSSVFELIPRITLSSFAAYLIAQTADIHIFHFIKQITGPNHLWLRNNVSTIIAQLLDCLVFFPLAFFGTVSAEVLISLIITSWIFKVPVALLDTACIYLSYWIKKPKPDLNPNQILLESNI